MVSLIKTQWHSIKHRWLKRYPKHLPPHVTKTWRAVKSQRLTYLSHARLNSLITQTLRVEAEALTGILIETGCALGGSAIVMCAAKQPTRPLEVYDLFGTIPAPTAKDGTVANTRFDVISAGQAQGIAGDTYYGYQPQLKAQVAANFATHGFAPQQHCVTLVEGLLDATLRGNEPVALAHIDVDWYDAVALCLNQIAPRLCLNGALIIDDYYDWPGCKKAVDAFLAQHPSDTYTVDGTAGHLVLIKRK